jgi:hypothetical protein
MHLGPYTSLPLRDTPAAQFQLVRATRDVIRMGAFPVWDGGPARLCPVLDGFFRRFGISAGSQPTLNSEQGQRGGDNVVS